VVGRYVAVAAAVATAGVVVVAASARGGGGAPPAAAAIGAALEKPAPPPVVASAPAPVEKPAPPPVAEAAPPPVEKAAPPVEKVAPSVEKAAPPVEKAPPPVEKAPPPVEKATAPVETVDYRALLDDANSLYTRGQPKAALARLERALQLQPNGDEALVLSARCHLDRGNVQKAVAAANLAVAANPDNADGYLVAGAALQQGGRNAEAKIAYGRYLQRAPKGRYASEVRSILRSLD
jgi:hypothetical protein